ncbi:unnamed protein product [Cuscuta campestris]|uniref:Uncharacterized protein n=1 Tax=Cuscuta campestris TaxID=132261 RepID=A0A484L9Q9_9ASTE|nr:unnamed protein product [Cuscuta campestris]
MLEEEKNGVKMMEMGRGRVAFVGPRVRASKLGRLSPSLQLWKLQHRVEQAPTSPPGSFVQVPGQRGHASGRLLNMPSPSFSLPTLFSPPINIHTFASPPILERISSGGRKVGGTPAREEEKGKEEEGRESSCVDYS